MVYQYDFLVIGGGVAGMAYALKVAATGKGKVALLHRLGPVPVPHHASGALDLVAQAQQQGEGVLQRRTDLPGGKPRRGRIHQLAA